ncbi:MAG: protein kinase, partial [Phototrophicales bacterium]
LTIRCTQTEGEYFAVNVPSGNLQLEDCVLSSRSRATVNVDGSNARVKLVNCSIIDGKVGLQLSKLAQATVEECDLSNHEFSQIIVDNANLGIRNCRIRDSQNAGILLRNSAQGQIEECQIYNNGFSAIDIR